MKVKNNNAGQSMFEVVLALAVIALVVVGVVVLSVYSVRNTTFSKNKTLAGRYAQEALEWLKDERNTDPASFRTHILTTTYCLDALAWTNIGSCLSDEVIMDTTFLREVTFASTSQNNSKGESVIIVNAKVVVSWTDAQGTHEVQSSTDMADFREL